MSDAAKPYQDYLDKEATIMGVLSAFAIGVAGLTTKEVLPVETTGELFPGTRADVWYIVAGSALFIVAAAAFYWQRANLLWHYGQLALWATDENTRANRREVADDSASPGRSGLTRRCSRPLESAAADRRDFPRTFCQEKRG